MKNRSGIISKTFLSFFIFFTFLLLNNTPACSKTVYGSTHLAMIRLKKYKSDLEGLFRNINETGAQIRSLNKKIRKSHIKIRELGKKITGYGKILRRLVRKILIFQEERSSIRLQPVNKSINYIIVSYDLKSILSREEQKLRRSIARKNKYHMLMNALNGQKKGLKHKIKYLETSKKSLSRLVLKTEYYIKSLRKKEQNKMSRFLKRKVIKLIHKIKKDKN